MNEVFDGNNLSRLVLVLINNDFISINIDEFTFMKTHLNPYIDLQPIDTYAG